jgi:hypothetical protein
MVAGHRIDDRAVDDVLGRVVLVIAHHADFDHRFLEKWLPAFATKHWACSRSDIDWKAEGIRSSALEFVAYSFGVLSRRAPCCERLSGHATCPGATTPRHRAVGIAGSFGTGEIADMAVMGAGRHH